MTNFSRPHTAATPVGTAAQIPAAPERRDVVFDIGGLTVAYGKSVAVRDVSLEIYRNAITAVIGPSGCGKSTFLRCLNRMNDLVPNVGIEGRVLYHGTDLYGDDVDPIEVRRRIGMVFQRPNPFPKSIYDNVAFGLRVLRMKDDLDGRVERALRRAALWDEVKNRLRKSALGLSGGQQQRLCIARAIAVEPEVVLLDEPASALDPIATSAIEDLMHELKRRLHARDRHSQHAAGGPCGRDDRVLLAAGRGRLLPARDPRRVRLDGEDLHPPGRRADRGLRHRAVRVRRSFQEELAALEGALQEEGELVLRALRARSTCSRGATTSSPTR